MIDQLSTYFSGVDINTNVQSVRVNLIILFWSRSLCTIISKLHSESSDHIASCLQIRIRCDIKSNFNLICFPPNDESTIKQIVTPYLLWNVLVIPRILTISLNIIIKLSWIITMVYDKGTAREFDFPSHFAIYWSRIFNQWGSHDGWSQGRLCSDADAFLKWI